MSEPLNTFEEDECCCKQLVKSLHRGIVGDKWKCPKCGTEWRAEVYKLDMGESITHWRPHSPIALI